MEETENRSEKEISASLRQELNARQRELEEVKKKLSVEETENRSEKEMKSEENFLDSSLLKRFREEIDDHYNIIHNVYESWDQWNLFCAVADRIEDCIEYLNKHAEPPKRTEFVIFLVYSYLICDAIRQIFFAFRDFKKQNKNVPLSPYKFDFYPESNQYFKEDIQKQVNDNTKEILTDDQFLKYIRALVFAHPFETSRSKILQKGERQYSPLIYSPLVDNKNNIGILIYSNKSGSKILRFPFPVLKEYIKSRYLLLNDIMENLKKITEVKEYEWKQHKVNRELSPIDILNDIIQILCERNIYEYDIVKAKEFLLCKLTRNENKNIVQEYHKKILSIIPSLCDAVDDLDYEKMKDILSDILHPLAEENPDEKNINYFIGKFRGDSKLLWPYMAKLLVKWAKKRGVVIEAEEMEKIEIDLLITAVCYFEKESKPQTPQNTERMRRPVCVVLADFHIPREQPDFVHSIRYPDGTYIKYKKGHRPIVAGTAPPGWEPANEDEAQEIDPVPPEYRAQHPQEEGESKENED